MENKNHFIEQVSKLIHKYLPYRRTNKKDLQTCTGSLYSLFPTHHLSANENEPSVLRKELLTQLLKIFRSDWLAVRSCCHMFHELYSLHVERGTLALYFTAALMSTMLFQTVIYSGGTLLTCIFFDIYIYGTI